MPNAGEAPYAQAPNLEGISQGHLRALQQLQRGRVRRAERGPEQELSDAARMEPCEGAQILARVGSEVVLASEVFPAVDQAIAPYKDRIPAHKLEMQRRLLIQRLLQGSIETKLIYLDARRSIPKENFPQIEESLGEQFERSELKRLIKSAKVETRRELDRKLREKGTSLERKKQAFMRRALAQTWAHQQINLNEEVTYDQMWEHYNQHKAEFWKPARARWEELVVRFSEYSRREEARAAIEGMGDRVALAGVPLADVARSMSDGTTASEGGQRDWTHEGSLVCEDLDRALFGLPVGRLSPILESENGYHIVRVTEREMAHHVPFSEAQTRIAPKISQQQSKQQLRAYVDRLREEIPVWTIFDERPQREQITGRSGSPRR